MVIEASMPMVSEGWEVSANVYSLAILPRDARIRRLNLRHESARHVKEGEWMRNPGERVLAVVDLGRVAGGPRVKHTTKRRMGQRARRGVV